VLLSDGVQIVKQSAFAAAQSNLEFSSHEILKTGSGASVEVGGKGLRK
jgi:hypothetical protein